MQATSKNLSAVQSDQTRGTKRCTNKHITTGSGRCTRILANSTGETVFDRRACWRQGDSEHSDFTVIHLQDLEVYQCNLNPLCLCIHTHTHTHTHICFFVARQPVVSSLCRLHDHTQIQHTWKDSHHVYTNIYLCSVCIYLFVCLFLHLRAAFRNLICVSLQFGTLNWIFCRHSVINRDNYSSGH